MLAKSFILALFALSVSALPEGHSRHMGHHHRTSLHLARRAESQQPPLVAREFGSPELTTIAKPRRRQRRAGSTKTRLCTAPKSSTVLTPISSTPAPQSPATTTEREPPKPTTSQDPVAPTPTTSEEPTPEPKPSTKFTPEPTETPAPPPPSTPSVGEFSGDGTFFNVGLGACGNTNNDSEFIVAVSHLLFDSFPGAGANPNLNPICGKRINVQFQGKSVDVVVQDRCPVCDIHSLDLSPAAFNAIANPDLGRIKVTWNWIG